MVDQDHDHASIRNKEGNKQIAQDDKIDDFFDERHFSYNKEKVDNRLADTGKMVEESKESPKYFSCYSIIEVDLIHHEDHHDSTMTSKNKS